MSQKQTMKQAAILRLPERFQGIKCLRRFQRTPQPGLLVQRVRDFVMLERINECKRLGSLENEDRNVPRLQAALLCAGLDAKVLRLEQKPLDLGGDEPGIFDPCRLRLL